MSLISTWISSCSAQRWPQGRFITIAKTPSSYMGIQPSCVKIVSVSDLEWCETIRDITYADPEKNLMGLLNVSFSCSSPSSASSFPPSSPSPSCSFTLPSDCQYLSAWTWVGGWDWISGRGQCLIKCVVWTGIEVCDLYAMSSGLQGYKSKAPLHLTFTLNLNSERLDWNWVILQLHLNQAWDLWLLIQLQAFLGLIYKACFWRVVPAIRLLNSID